MAGVKDRRLSEQLSMDSEFTLAKAIQKVRQSETIKRQQTILHSSGVGGDAMTNADAIKTNMKKGEKFQHTGQRMNKGQKSDAQGEREWPMRKRMQTFMERLSSHTLNVESVTKKDMLHWSRNTHQFKCRVVEVTVTQTETDFKAAYPAVFQGLGKMKEPFHT